MKNCCIRVTLTLWSLGTVNTIGISIYWPWWVFIALNSVLFSSGLVSGTVKDKFCFCRHLDGRMVFTGGARTSWWGVLCLLLESSAGASLWSMLPVLWKRVHSWAGIQGWLSTARTPRHAGGRWSWSSGCRPYGWLVASPCLCWLRQGRDALCRRRADQPPSLLGSSR